MRVCVFGLWHLGTVTASGLASVGHEVIGLDSDWNGKAPVDEPGLDLSRVRFTTDAADVHNVDVVWVTFDTPVDDDDHADVEFVVRRIESLFDFLSDGTLVVISSQLPAGTTRRIEEAFGNRKQVDFVYSPENLRLGKAMQVFLQPDRVVAGARNDRARDKFTKLMAPITSKIEWMSVESAEMTKHAINAFLATSITFINEIAVACEAVGADAKEVERGLKTDSRIGPGAYLSPGAAFSGGTLARDVQFLAGLADEVPLLASVKTSNEAHQRWPLDKLHTVLGDLRGRTIAVLGLTYKPGTNTLRRSAAVELARALSDEGASVRAFDPAVKDAPFPLAESADAAMRGADAVVIATPWPEFRSLAFPAGIIVIDANRLLTPPPNVRYFAVGSPA